MWPESFLNCDSFLFQTQEIPWKSITLQNEHLKKYKYLIALSLSNASKYVCGYFHLFEIKLGKYGISFWKQKTKLSRDYSEKYDSGIL